MTPAERAVMAAKTCLAEAEKALAAEKAAGTATTSKTFEPPGRLVQKNHEFTAVRVTKILR